MTPGDMARIHALCSGETRAWSADEFTDLLSGFGVFVCSGPSGFAIGRVIAPEVELLLIATHPDAQRQGLGRARLAAFEAHAQSAGAQRAFLEVSEHNSAALALYSRAGWVRDGVRTAYYAQQDGQFADAVLMSKALGAQSA